MKIDAEEQAEKDSNNSNSKRRQMLILFQRHNVLANLGLVLFFFHPFYHLLLEPRK